jgi:hypothetical protein
LPAQFLRAVSVVASSARPVEAGGARHGRRLAATVILIAGARRGG